MATLGERTARRVVEKRGSPLGASMSSQSAPIRCNLEAQTSPCTVRYITDITHDAMDIQPTTLHISFSRANLTNLLRIAQATAPCPVRYSLYAVQSILTVRSTVLHIR